MKYSLLRLFIFLFIFPFAATAGIVPLNTWKFREAGSKRWMAATVPGTVHTDLQRLKKIPDPFTESNEQKVQWVGEKNWEYQTSFSYPKEIKHAATVQLVFDGLDTYADVFLNDSLVLSAENMFVNYSVNVSGLLKGENTLRIIFYAPEARARTAAAKLKYTLPEGLRSFTRKAQYHYGWDWGPKNINLWHLATGISPI